MGLVEVEAQGWEDAGKVIDQSRRNAIHETLTCTFMPLLQFLYCFCERGCIQSSELHKTEGIHLLCKPGNPVIHENELQTLQIPSSTSTVRDHLKKSRWCVRTSSVRSIAKPGKGFGEVAG